MTVLERIAGLWFAVLDRSSEAAAALTARLSARRHLGATLGDDDELHLFRDDKSGRTSLGHVVPGAPDRQGRQSRLLRRSRVTLDLSPKDFVFRSIDLPGRANEFIESIVKTQIDKLTPWRPEQVLFGWRPSLPRADGSVAVNIGATDRDRVMPLLARLQGMGAAEIVARVALPPEFGAPFSTETRQEVVVARASSASLSTSFWRKVIGGLTAGVVVVVIGASLFAQVATSVLSGDADDLDRVAAAKRAVIAKAVAGDDPAGGMRQRLLQRKSEVPFATLVIEAVSRLLPDDSYVTSLDITGTRLQIVGFTGDAPALIRLFEQSDQFTGASFFAPTTRLPDDPADRFSIEVTIKPGAFAR